MADERFYLDVTIQDEGGWSNNAPLHDNVGRYLLLVTTGFTADIAKSAMSGSSSTSACMAIPVGKNSMLTLYDGMEYGYVCVAAVRPGCQFYFDNSQCQNLGSDRSTITFSSVKCPYRMPGNQYLTKNYLNYLYSSRGNPYLIKDIENASGSTYSGMTAKMTDCTSMFDFRTADTLNTMTTSQMGKRYAAERWMYFNTDWIFGNIDYYTVPQGYYITWYQTGVYISISNNIGSPSDVNIEIWAGSMDEQTYVKIAETINPIPMSAYGTIGGYYMQWNGTGGIYAGEIAEVGLAVNISQARNLYATMYTDGMGSVNFVGMCDSTIWIPLTADIEIQSLSIEISY